MKSILFKITALLLLCSQQLQAGRIYDEFEDISKIKWIGNYKIVAGGTDDWAKRAGDIYRLSLDNPSDWAFLVYELPENEIAKEVIIDYYSPSGLRPTLAVKNPAGVETKYVEGWDNGYPDITDNGNGIYRCVLKDELIPEDAVQVAVYLDAQSDIELLRNVVYYGEEYQAPDYNAETNYYRAQKLLEKASRGENLTIGVVGGSMTAGANAEPMATNCYGARLKAWFEKQYSINVDLINIGIGSTNSYFGCIRAEEKLLRYNPDLIVIEYAVNDQLDDVYLEFYEGLIRKCWKNPGEPAVVSLMLCTQAGISRIERQVPIAQHYNLPIVSYSDAIKEEIIAGEKTWSDYYRTSTLSGGDGIHPNTAAHQKIADLIAARLSKSTDASNAGRMESMPAPMYSNALEDAFYLSEKDITPTISGNWQDGGSIWDFGTGKGWRSETAGSELQFKFNGTAVAVTYWKRPASENFGTAQIWVDDKSPVTIDGSNGEHIDQLLLKDLGIGEHILHIKLLEDKKFEVVCIAVSGERSCWNGSFQLENIATCLKINADGKSVSMSDTGSDFTVSETSDGYICFKCDNSYLSANEDGSTELKPDLDTSAKFMYVDKGEKAAIRAIANGKYLSQARNSVTATSTELSENEYFVFTSSTSGISDIESSAIGCHTAAGRIIVRNATGHRLEIFDLSGRLLHRQLISANPTNIPFAKGHYLVHVGDKSFKCNL